MHHLKTLLTLAFFLQAIIPYLLMVPPIIIFEVLRQILRLCLCIRHGKWINLLAPSDAFFLVHGQNPEDHFCWHLIIRGVPNIEAIIKEIQSKLTDIPRLKNYPAECCGYFYWLQDKDFSLKDHVQVHNCNPPKNQKEFCKIIADILSQPMTEGKSPWKIFVFPLDDAYAGECRYIILLKVHHLFTDAIGTVHLLRRCFIDESTVKQIGVQQKFTRIPLKSKLKMLAKGILHYPQYIYSINLRKDKNVLQEVETSGNRVTGFSKISLPRFKNVRKMSGATINDIGVACIAGALKKYCQEQSPKMEISARAVIPFSMRSLSDEECNNQIAMIAINLPMDEQTMMERLKKTQLETNKLKTLGFNYITNVWSKILINRLPSFFLKRLVPYDLNSTCLITSGLVSQTQFRSVFGEDIVDCGAFTPTRLGVNIAMSSYNGFICFGMTCDEAVMSDTDVNSFLEKIEGKFEELETNAYGLPSI